MQDHAQAIPTKRFFVSMLTRDISLADAILDLLDNCLDGALRVAGSNQVDYRRHKVSITLSSTEFVIEDNCGGIPREVAKNYAFKMGREPDDQRDNDTETIGMYGVGMKRAIFKMGREALVKTRHGDDAFQVPITSHWLEMKGWDPLPIEELAPACFDAPGTRIEVTQLYSGVARHLGNSAFENEVRTAIAEHFTTFLQLGLTVELNGTVVEPVKVTVLVTVQKDGPQPFVYQKLIDEVEVSIVVGLNTGRTHDDEDDNGFDRDRTSATSGWTVFCNDRAVIVGDKGRLTGWGDGIPLYHPQFAMITGIVQFRSKHADKLPVTTTKRALDTSSNVWLESLVKMKEGMRIWVNYTNDWKNHPRSDQSKHWESAKALSISETVSRISSHSLAKRSGTTLELNPLKQKILPVPASKTPTSRRIVYARPIEEIKLVSKMLFDRTDEKPGLVGEKCFEALLDQAQKADL